MKKIVIKLKPIDYSKIPDPLAKNSFRVHKASKIEDKRKKKPKYKKNYTDEY